MDIKLANVRDSGAGLLNKSQSKRNYFKNQPAAQAAGADPSR